MVLAPVQLLIYRAASQGRSPSKLGYPPPACLPTTDRYSHIPLTLFYSSLTKLFLLFCLSIWRPDDPDHRHPSQLGTGSDDASTNPNAPRNPIPNTNTNTAAGLAGLGTHPLVLSALGLLDADTLDRAWVVRNVLGGMAAGFGLRGAYSLPLSP